MANFWNVFQIAELRRKLIFTVMMVGVYRLGIFISVPGVDSEELRRAFQSLSGTLFGLANMFSGGAFEQASIFGATNDLTDEGLRENGWSHQASNLAWSAWVEEGYGGRGGD